MTTMVAMKVRGRDVIVDILESGLIKIAEGLGRVRKRWIKDDSKDLS